MFILYFFLVWFSDRNKSSLCMQLKEKSVAMNSIYGRKSQNTQGSSLLWCILSRYINFTWVLHGSNWGSGSFWKMYQECRNYSKRKRSKVTLSLTYHSGHSNLDWIVSWGFFCFLLIHCAKVLDSQYVLSRNVSPPLKWPCLYYENLLVQLQ